ncbi:MAG: prepilin peptidase [Candidatus Brocadiia bacterium]|nr:MAG: prepilin peptidase [Candidatus Brocadiia bacterium]
MPVPEWIWIVFVFAFGCCIGSFLNVVIYRLPRDKSLVKPPSSCPSCGKNIRFYDNIPLLSWLVLAGKCRFCKAPISPRYFVIELLTGLVFTAVFYLYFYRGIIEKMPPFLDGGWIIYLMHIAMLGAFIAASAIDLELWIIPLSICWFVTAVGIVGSTAGGYLIDFQLIRSRFLLPTTSDPFLAESSVAALAVGAGLGLVISMILLKTGVIKQSYEDQQSDWPGEEYQADGEKKINHYLESFREILFLLPMLLCAAGACFISKNVKSVDNFWVNLTQHPAFSGFLGSLWGYFVGCAVVWATRIFGTLAFGKEAMGLGDVHFMGAAGAILGPVPVFIAFFVSPFFGLGWAGIQLFFKKTRQIPYGPFLSLGLFVVMMFRDRIFEYLAIVLFK